MRTVPSTLIRWAFLAKTHRSIWKRTWKWIKTKCGYIVSAWKVKNESKWKRWPKIWQARVFVACAWSSTYVPTKSWIVFERFSVDSRKRIKTVVWTRVDRCVFHDERKRILLKTHYCGEGLSSEKKEKRNCFLVFTSFIKRAVKRFHVAVVQQLQRNVQKERDPRAEMLCCQSKPLAFSPFLLSLPLLKLSIDPFTTLYLLVSNAINQT